jgi:hypothetical protein
MRAKRLWLFGAGGWALDNGMWTLGKEHPLDAIGEFQKYSLAGVAQRIKGDVLHPVLLRTTHLERHRTNQGFIGGFPCLISSL